jgi:hypothetical protein
MFICCSVSGCGTRSVPRPFDCWPVRMCKNRREPVRFVREKIVRTCKWNRQPVRMCNSHREPVIMFKNHCEPVRMCRNYCRPERVCRNLCGLARFFENNFEPERILKNGFGQLYCSKKRCRPLSSRLPHWWVTLLCGINVASQNKMHIV